MKIASFDQTLEMLEQLDGWLSTLGIAPKRDRWHQALETVKQAREQRAIVERGGSRAPIANYVDGLFEAMEVHEVMCAFKSDTSPALKEKLRRALSGPVSPLDESPKNSSARNTMFELCLAADWKNDGLNVEIGEPDVRLRFAKDSFQVECKRPFSAKSVGPNIADAGSQLGHILDLPENKNDYGIVAVSLTRVFTEENRMCLASEGTGRQVIAGALEEILRNNDNDWGIRRFHELHERIVAVMFNLSVPWDVKGERLIHLSTANYLGTHGESEGFTVLSDNLKKLRPAA
jgi:hypothetical protein